MKAYASEEEIMRVYNGTEDLRVLRETGDPENTFQNLLGLISLFTGIGILVFGNLLGVIWLILGVYMIVTKWYVVVLSDEVLSDEAMED